jgi:hypothetical protein
MSMTKRRDKVSCETDSNGRLIPRWFWTLFVCLPLGLMAWWFFRWFFLPSYKRTSSVEIDTPRARVARQAVKKDDFQRLKGIGPKTASALYQSRIYSFEQLALMDSSKLTGILKDHNLPAGQIDYWQEQAALAAAEDWTGLEKLQS